MFDRDDLDAAVSRRLITPSQRDGIVEIARTRRAGSEGADEEQFRFLTSFNDVFVTIACALLIGAVGALAGVAGDWGPPLAVAAVSWGLAEYFTRVRRMALPSIVLLLAFTGGVFALGAAVNDIVNVTSHTVTEAAPWAPSGRWTHVERQHLPLWEFGLALAALAAGVAALLHWRRFHVPITVAVGAAAAVGVAVTLVVAAVGGADAMKASVLPLVVAALGGVCVFALAMRFDISDRARMTRRTDIAFWLHLLAAPLIIHPLFQLTGITRGDPGTLGAIAVVVVYLLLTAVALAIDRRALLVSALIYVGYALQQLITGGRDVGENFALTALLLGGGLVLLSALWPRLRAAVLSVLPPGLRNHLPAAT